MTRQKKSTEERRQEIAAAALDLAVAHGVGQLTTASIARAVGLAEGSIFRHFDSKQGILLAAIAQLDELLLASLPHGHGDPVARLGAFFTTRVAMMGARPGLARLLFSDELGLEAGAEGTVAVARVKQRSLGFVRSCLEEAHARDRLRPGLTPESLVVIVQGAALALVHFGPLLLEGAPQQERAERVWETLRRMMEK